MNLDRAVLAFAGLIVLVSLALGYWVSPYWLLLTAFAGLNMVQAAFTGFCPAALIFKLFGVRSGAVHVAVLLRRAKERAEQRLLHAGVPSSHTEHLRILWYAVLALPVGIVADRYDNTSCSCSVCVCQWWRWSSPRVRSLLVSG